MNGLYALVAVAQAQGNGVGPNSVTGPWALVNASFLCFWDPAEDRTTTAVSAVSIDSVVDMNHHAQ